MKNVSGVMKKCGHLEHMTQSKEVHHKASNTYHSIKDDMYLKRVTWNFPDNWFETYQKIHEFEPRIIEIYGLQDKTLYMRKLEGQILESCMTEKYYSQMIDILNNIFIFNKNNNPKFYHRDAQIRNFMVEDGIVYLIDPDSFVFYYE